MRKSVEDWADEIQYGDGDGETMAEQHLRIKRVVEQILSSIQKLAPARTQTYLKKEARKYKAKPQSIGSAMLLRLISAADDLESFLGANSGHTDDWPIHIKVDGDVAQTLADKLTALNNALKPWRGSWILNIKNIVNDETRNPLL